MLRLKLLGGLAITRDGGPLDVTGSLRRPLLLLALLAVAGRRGVPRDRILLHFWGGSAVGQARGALRQTLFRLRRDLGAPDVVLGTTELRLNDAVITSDVAEFAEAVALGDHERAARLHEGPLLADVPLRGAREFERWLDGERARTAQQAMRAFTKLATSAAARDDHRAAVQWWQRVAEIDPLSSRAAAGIMIGLVAMHERAAAVQHGRLHQRLLLAERGADRDDHVATLLAELAARPVPVATGDADPTAATPAPRTPIDPTPSPRRPGRRLHLTSLLVVLVVVLLAWTLALAP